MPLVRHSRGSLWPNCGFESWVGDPAADHLDQVCGEWPRASYSISAGSAKNDRRYPVEITHAAGGSRSAAITPAMISPTDRRTLLPVVPTLNISTENGGGLPVRYRLCQAIPLMTERKGFLQPLGDRERSSQSFHVLLERRCQVRCQLRHTLRRANNPGLWIKPGGGWTGPRMSVSPLLDRPKR